MTAPVLLSVAIIVVFGFSTIIRKALGAVQAQKAALQLLIASKGWRLVEGPRATMLHLQGTTDEVNWELESATRGKVTSTRWWSDDVVCPQLVASIRSRRTFDFLKGRMVDTGIPIRTASDKYVVVVRPESGLDGFVTPDLERALDRWFALKMQPGAQQTLSVDVGAQIRVYSNLRVKPEHLETFIAIGVQTSKAIELARATQVR